jgi:hypothetical protein
MLTQTTIITTNNHNNNPKCTDGDALRDDWDASIFNAQGRAFERKHATAMDEPDTAKRDALWARLSAPRHCWFSAELERSVTEQAPLVIKCLDDVRQAPAHPEYAAAPAARHPRVCRARALPRALAPHEYRQQQQPRVPQQQRALDARVNHCVRLNDVR